MRGVGCECVGYLYEKKLLAKFLNNSINNKYIKNLDESSYFCLKERIRDKILIFIANDSKIISFAEFKSYR